MMPPCYECKDRAPGCHGKCQRYAAFAAEREDIRKKKALEGDASDASFCGRERMKISGEKNGISHTLGYINRKKRGGE